jgi:hypothetical protein
MSALAGISLFPCLSPSLRHTPPSEYGVFTTIGDGVFTTIGVHQVVWGPAARGRNRHWHGTLAYPRLGLFSVVTLLAHHLTEGKPFPVRRAAWYEKRQAIFSDTIALVRRHSWTQTGFANSPGEQRLVEIPPPVLVGLVDAICYAI